MKFIFIKLLKEKKFFLPFLLYLNFTLMHLTIRINLNNLRYILRNL
jgi:hypothetical protein